MGSGPEAQGSGQKAQSSMLLTTHAVIIECAAMHADPRPPLAPNMLRKFGTRLPMVGEDALLAAAGSEPALPPEHFERQTHVPKQVPVMHGILF